MNSDEIIHTRFKNIVKTLLTVITLSVLLISVSIASDNASKDLFYMDSEMVIPTNKSYLIIRKGPGFTYPVTYVVDSITALTVVEKGLWYKILYNDSYGYVYSNNFIDSEAYEPGRLKGYTIGIDPDGQKVLDMQSEFIAPQSKLLTERMAERNVGLVTGSFDYEINLKIAQKLKQALEDEGATVVMTRENSDVFISNRERAELLNQYNCEVIISVSCESSDNALINGIQAYVPRLSTGENTTLIAETILTNLSGELGITKPGVNIANNITFLNWTKGNALKVELGYLSNASDEKRLIDDTYQQLCARTIKNAIVGVFIEKTK